MKKIGSWSAGLFSLAWICGCSSLDHTGNGALVGGGLGAAAGALAGHALGSTAAGAAIGLGAGALTGGLIGHSMDKQDEKRAEARSAAIAQAQALGITDVVQMAHQHISDNVIINQIRSSGTIFHLSASDINFMKENGVSDAVIVEMQVTARRHPHRIYSVEPVYQPVYVVEQPPPPVSVGVGFGYSSCGHWH